MFSLFARISLQAESEEDRFPLGQYQDIVHSNILLDMAKLYDIAAVYGPSNSAQVRQLTANVFENDMRFLAEYKESVDMMITLLKKCFNAALKVTEMINGDTVLQHTQRE